MVHICRFWKGLANIPQDFYKQNKLCTQTTNHKESQHTEKNTIRIWKARIKNPKSVILLYRFRMLFAEILKKQHEIARHCSFVPAATRISGATKRVDVNLSDVRSKLHLFAECMVQRSNLTNPVIHIAVGQEGVLQHHDATSDPSLSNPQMDRMPRIYQMESRLAIDRFVYQQLSGHWALSGPWRRQRNQVRLVHSSVRFMPHTSEAVA